MSETERRFGFDRTVLKLIAVATMLCDHACCVFITQSMHPLRVVGRLAFPIFAYGVAEGAGKTKHPGRYCVRLFVFALISEIPFDLALMGRPFDPDDQNVFFTLLFGLLSVLALQALEKKGKAYALLSVFPLAASVAAAELLKTDYAGSGVLAIFVFAVALRFRDKPVVYALLLILAAAAPCVYYSSYYGGLRWNPYETPALAAVILLLIYNGERGKAHLNKYWFYVVYPAHLLLFAGIRAFAAWAAAR